MVEVVEELTKASWTAGVEVRGFHCRRRPAITAKNTGIFDQTVPNVHATSAEGGATRLFPAYLRFQPRTRMETKRRTSQLLWR